MKKILITIGVIALAAGFIWAGKAWNNFQVSARTSRFNDQLGDLFAALQKYKERVGTYPTGNNAEIAKALNGSNNRNVIVLISARVERNDKGEFVDPWGTPLRIYYSDTGILIRSAGPNRRFDDSAVMECDDFFRSN